MATQTITVISDDSASGANTSSTSPTRRSTTPSSTKMAIRAISPASVKARTMVPADSKVLTAGPVASGATVRTAVTKRASTAGSPALPLG